MDKRQQSRIMRIDLLVLLLCSGVAALSQAHTSEEVQMDTKEGSTVQLKCRFEPVLKEAKSFWLSHTNNNHDNAVIDAVPLSHQYNVHMDLKKGIYDLEIRNVSYEKNNGKYECRIKMIGSGDNLYHKNVTLTVLRPPGPPYISFPRATATEGTRMELQCNTHGGSPEPEVIWYRSNSNGPVHFEQVYSFEPTKADDGAVFRCVVRNRAMPEGKTLSANITLNVNYFPRVSAGPPNPLRVLVNTPAQLNCRVDSKPISRVQWIKEDTSLVITTSLHHTISVVTLQDAGKYKCIANNSLSRSGEDTLELDVLYPPNVVIEGEPIRVMETEDSIALHCNVSANPPASVIEWLREDRPEFREFGTILRLNRVTADNAGNYTCRAINSIQPTGGKRTNHSASARVSIRIRHKPGPARVTPDSPIAVDGSKVILTCMANPPGYPEAQYRWWRETDGQDILQEPTGSKFEITSVQLGSDGTYKCQAINEIGNGDAATVRLTVNLPPKFQARLQSHVTKKVGESSYRVTCTASGKPKPTVRWLKDGEVLTADESLYKVDTTTIEGRGNVYVVNSTLSFIGVNRPEHNKVIASDRGTYTCVFENDVKEVESEMMLKIEHAPIVLHKHNKVAYNLRDTAEVTCKVQAWPKPEFHWFYGSNDAHLQSSSNDGHYEIGSTSENDDIYTSVLKIANIRESDYGKYSCRAWNAQGSITSVITLQPTGAPEKPTDLTAVEIGPDYVVLQWDIGFDGGLAITKYFVSYLRMSGDNDRVSPDCIASRTPPGQWNETDCHRSNPCNITNLEQHQTYSFKVQAYNTKNQSEYSDERRITTTVSKIPIAQRLSYDPETSNLVIHVEPTCLALVAQIEKSESGLSNAWVLVDEWHIQALGNVPNRIEDILVDHEPSSGKPRFRVRLCLEADKTRQKCGDWAEAEIGPTYITQAGALATPTLIALVVSGAVFLLFAALLLLFCRCKRKHAAKAKDYEMDSNAVRPSLVTGNGQQTQAPPPYYAENKALEHSLDRALAMEDSKTPAYAQPGYGYHQPNHNINGENGVNMGYLDNSYSNSNNGGSVNSQDSIWQMKSAAANGANPPYDLGGYAATESDYPAHPHYLPQREDYRESHNLSRQQFCSEPFATVVKSQKHVDSPYDVSGLPYQEAYDEDAKPPQQVSLSYDESLESGYSTPNGRRPRIIREIIV